MMLNTNSFSLIFFIVDDAEYTKSYSRILNENDLNNELNVEKNIKDNKLFNTISLEV